METKETYVWAVCECGWSEHQFRAVVYEDADTKEFLLEIHLATWRNFWQRLWHGLCYAFGHTSRYGSFDEVIVKREDVARLRDLCIQYLGKTEDGESRS